METLNYLYDNADAVLAAVLAVHGAAVLIANLTPTPKDNEALARVYRWIEVAAGIITRRAKR